ncbi:helix-turn-helix domain-containing protein [Leuconostoc citreum]|uniref:helix-turn-helix domain-containing protein n=1 Tax=Leuconostoc citreum TaxID=33964 RepID=UPI0012BA4858|nr:helix-turn-helix transcriptional regulator [Leuconostoc citreum]QGN59915.1 helix-turn-helix domain-containing protein [Leuconostoc citreum]QGN61494.1 helix-turn-helix domain-containing protein [Leuconostoc citreum]
MALIDRVKETAKKSGYSLTEVAIKAGIGEKSIYAWTTREPTVATLQKVADVLHVSTDYLLGRTDEMNATSVSKKSHIDLKDALDDEIMLAFDGHDIPDEDKVKIREYIELLDMKRRSEHE